MTLTSLNEYFVQLFRMTKSRMAVHFTQLWGLSIFEQNISRASVATH